MELTELLIPAAIIVIGLIVWTSTRNLIVGDPISDAVAIVHGVEHLWEQGRIAPGDRLDEAVYALTKRHRYLDYESAKLFIEGAVRMLKKQQAGEALKRG